MVTPFGPVPHPGHGQGHIHCGVHLELKCSAEMHQGVHGVAGSGHSESDLGGRQKWMRTVKLHTAQETPAHPN